MQYSLHVEDEIRKELTKDETKLWSTQPNPNRLLTALDIFLIPSSIFMVGFAAYMAAIMVSYGMGVFILIPVVIAGLYYLLGRFIVKRIRKKKTIYILTDKRAVEILAGRSRKVKSIYYSQIDDLKNTCNKKGEGRITFEKGNMLRFMYENSGMDFFMSQSLFPEFYDIEDVAEPLSIINEQMEKI